MAGDYGIGDVLYYSGQPDASRWRENNKFADGSQISCSVLRQEPHDVLTRPSRRSAVEGLTPHLVGVGCRNAGRKEQPVTHADGLSLLMPPVVTGHYRFDRQQYIVVLTGLLRCRDLMEPAIQSYFCAVFV